MRTIKEWQTAVFQLAKEKGFHSRRCEPCEGAGAMPMAEFHCRACNGSGKVEVDHKSATRIASRFERIHSEISEAGECVALGQMGLRWEWPKGQRRGPSGAVCIVTDEQHSARGYKPEGFGVELADVFMRLVDQAEVLGLELCDHFEDRGHRVTDPEIISADLCALHGAITDASRAGRQCRSELNKALNYLRQIASETGVDLFALAELKFAYNKTRPTRHGWKRC